MICAKCGFENNDGAKTCAKCGSFLDPHDEEKKKHRRVVQLPSNQTPGQKTPEERPLETRQAQREAAARSDASGAKSPTPRRRSSAGATGKIPALKRPAHEDGKIPAEQRRPVSAARPSEPNEPSYTPPSRARSKQVIIDDAVVAAEAATQTRDTRPARSGVYQSSTRRPVKEGSNRTKSLIIGVAILIVLCLVAIGMFLVSTGSGEKTVSFDTDGGTVIGNQYVMQDEKLARPANPTRPGYEFDGWYLDANHSEEAEFPIDVTQNMTLYAKWKQESSSSAVPSTITDATQSNDAATNANNSNGSAAANAGSGSSSANAGSNGGSGSSSAARPGTGSSRPSTGSGSASGGSSSGAPSAPAAPSAPVNGNTASNGPVDVSVVAANGRTLSGTVTLHDGFVIPNSSEKAYSVEELKALGLNDAEICIARNEPYARMGYSFRNPQLQAYFNARSWYHNTGWRGQLANGSAAYVTAHNLLTLSKETPGAAAWNSLSTR